MVARWDSRVVGADDGEDAVIFLVFLEEEEEEDRMEDMRLIARYRGMVIYILVAMVSEDSGGEDSKSSVMCLHFSTRDSATHARFAGPDWTPKTALLV